MRLITCARLVSLFLAFSLSSVTAQENRYNLLGQLVPVAPHQTIPDDPFASWSLFLVCDPAWLVPSQEAALRDLQIRYESFGKTTGPTHAAVWFEVFTPETIDENGRVFSWHQIPASIDVNRNVKFCEKFQLIPSQGPHIVVTTVHPDRWEFGDSMVVLSFAGRSARDIQDQLSKLNDQIAVGRLSQEKLDSVGWWNKWQEIIEAVCNWLSKVKWSVDAKIVKVERSGLCK